MTRIITLQACDNMLAFYNLTRPMLASMWFEKWKKSLSISEVYLLFKKYCQNSRYGVIQRRCKVLVIE